LSEQFPPVSNHPLEVTGMVLVFASVVEGRTATYVSSPLTTGRRAFEWHARMDSVMAGDVGNPANKGAGDFRTEVIEPNREQAASYVRELRRQTGRVVIDPTALEDVPGWSQDDYRDFWGRVIERYADTVVLRDGWEYSSGCAYEFLVAHNSGAAVLREDQEPLRVEVGRALLQRAFRENSVGGIQADFLRFVGEALASPPGTEPK
jgi:hypothetical protein